MKKFALVSMAMLLVVVSLFSDNVKALGSSFSLLIPDNYEDVKSFPDRLNLEESSHFEVGINNGTNGTAFLGLSRIGERFKSRHEFTLKTTEDQSSKVSTSYRESEYIDTQNQFGFKLGGLNIGFLAEFHSSEDGTESESYNESYSSDYSNISKRDNYSERYNDLFYNGIGISAGFGETKSFSLALAYKYEESGDYEYGYNLRKSFNPDSLSYESSSYNDKSDEEYYDEFSLSLIKDFGKNHNSRIYTKFSYRIIGEKYDVDYKMMDNQDYINNSESEMSHSWGDISDGKSYGLTLGYGSVKELDKLNIYTGFLAEFIYEDLEANIFDDYYSKVIVADSTEYFNTGFDFYKDKKDYYSTLKLPFGLSYQIRDWCKVAGSITFTTQYHNYDNSTEYKSRYDHLTINASNNLSIVLQPIEKLQLGIYNINDLSAVSNWEAKATYLF